LNADVKAQVIVVGAGPTGLLLANELALAGVDVLVLDKLSAHTGQSKALNLQPRTAEILDLRGWLAPIMDQAAAQIPSGHYAGIPLDYQHLDSRFRFQVGIPQARVEKFLEERLVKAGVRVLRGYEMIALEQQAEGVVVTAVAPATERGAVGARESARERRFECEFLIGADGSRSTVRKQLGVDFPGLEGRFSLVVADVELGESGDVPETWCLPTFNEQEGGDAFLVPLGEGVYRMIFGGAEQQTVPRDAPVTEAEIRFALEQKFANPPQLKAIRWASRFTDASRQVATYRVERVLLAGDAAHIHFPAGGQGLNLGMQDAFNLGWKLAAVLKSGAASTLLDTYHAERHPVGARVLQNARAQATLWIPDPDMRAVHGVLAFALGAADANRRLADMVSGLDIRYEIAGSPPHALLGSRVPELSLLDGRGALRLSRSADAHASRTIEPWHDRLSTEVMPACDGTAVALLIRPDGHICWAGDLEFTGLTAALDRWFGPAVSDLGVSGWRNSHSHPIRNSPSDECLTSETGSYR
jgi:2-polyprenyl-6-methoxyphenol hydroxylase-like FAD-dependent oxidoreductase